MSPSGKVPGLSASLSIAALDSMSDALLVVGRDGALLHVNPAAEELFGRSRERSVGTPARSLPRGAEVAFLAERAYGAEIVTSGEFPAPLDPSVLITAEASPLFEGSACVGAVMVMRTPRSSSRALDFDALAAGLAHEIKNPLAGLQGSAELLAREADGSAREYAQVIAREAKRVDGLVRELLDLARPAALQSVPVNVHTILGDVRILSRGLPGADRISFVERYDPSLPDVVGDPEKLTQVVLNLVRNAVDAVAGVPHPEVVFETGVASQRLRSASGRMRPLARIAVLDNGRGISDAMLARLFTPFATSKAHGTGLGLAVSRRIVEAHGGRIEVRNRPTRGVEAAVYLPLGVSP